MSVSTNKATKETVETPMIPLDAFSFPLHGRRLIEASAGTGKTYTIANLYLRLLMPTKAEHEFAHPLTVDQILVVTFTEAATAELKDRIRQRIRQARMALLQNNSGDVFLSQWLTFYTEEEKSQGIERLLYAEKQMDEAAIFTIHGFCQRMLSQHAFESRMLFQQEVETDASIPLGIAVKDVWRAHIYPMSESMASMVRNIWSSPSALLKDLKVLQGQPEIDVHGSDFDIDGATEASNLLLKAVKASWLNQSTDIVDVLDNSGVKGTFWYNTPKMQAKRDQLLKSLSDWASGDTFELLEGLKRFDQDELALQVKKNGLLPQHTFFEQVRQLRNTFPTAEKLKPTLLKRYWEATQVKLAEWRQRHLKLTFDDLLTTLDSALQGKSGQTLGKRILQMYPLAMIDEFQDTDPVQYRIFNQIYSQSSQEASRPLTTRSLVSLKKGLIMIGDPKQAIYAFRGADVYTYLKAKQSVDAVYSLATNYRSSAAMIQSVNQLFLTQEAPFKVSGIPFVAVADRGTTSQFCRSGEPQPAMQFLLAQQDKPFSKDGFLTSLSQTCASHLHGVLLEGQTGHALLDGRGVQPKDIAVLVAGYTQAQKMKQALAERGIASVYLSDRGSVFDSPEAHDLWIILQAIHEKDKETSMRSALATSLLGQSHQQLDVFNHDDLQFEVWSERFQRYSELWDQEGLLPMLRVFMSDLNLAGDLLNRFNGERRLTNVLHLGEKLQQQASQLESKENLLRYFLLSIQNSDGNHDEQKIRLESDAELVRIITVHKSKGLEYPLVYLPFALQPFTNRDKHALFHQQALTSDTNSNVLWYSAIPDEQQRQQHEAELYATEIRLAYVALTRAREACFIGCAEIGKGATQKAPEKSEVHLSGVGSLLYASEERPFGELEDCLNAFVMRVSGQHNVAPKIDGSFNPLACVDTSWPQELPMFVSQAEQTPNYQNRLFQGRIERDWWVGSYSSLIVGDSAHHTSQEMPGLDETLTNHVTAEETLERVAMIDADDDVILKDRFHFPKGAKPGVFLHDILEGKALTGLSQPPAFKTLLLSQYQNQMEAFFNDNGYEEWGGVLFDWLRDMLSTPLLKEVNFEVSLSELSVQQICREMEFHLPVSGFKALQLDAIARRYDVVSKQAPSIQERSLKGILKGYIDLLFEWQGKYYVVDYKSNHLGHHGDDYHQTALADAIASHRYDLQYQLYTLALHRYLQTRIPNYDYDTHVGGVLYLFLRGMDGETQQGVFQTRLPKAHVMEMDTLFQGGLSSKQSNISVHANASTSAKASTSEKGGQYDLF